MTSAVSVASTRCDNPPPTAGGPQVRIHSTHPAVSVVNPCLFQSDVLTVFDIA